MDTNMQNLNTNEMTGRGVIVLNVSEMPQENISVGKGKNYLLVGDNAVWLKKIPDNSIDSIVTDPPAGISFMARGWDSDKGGRDNWIAWMCEVATECKRVLKPGGHAFVWAIPRTSHWTATAWENAGFEIRDVVAHVFGSGFPKSLNIGKKVDELQGNEREVVGIKRAGIAESPFGSPDESKKHIPDTKGNSEWEGWGTALKPAREDWILMRKPLEKGLTIAENVLTHGTGGINIEKSRVPTQEDVSRRERILSGEVVCNGFCDKHEFYPRSLADICAFSPQQFLDYLQHISSELKAYSSSYSNPLRDEVFAPGTLGKALLGVPCDYDLLALRVGQCGHEKRELQDSLSDYPTLSRLCDVHAHQEINGDQVFAQLASDVQTDTSRLLNSSGSNQLDYSNLHLVFVAVLFAYNCSKELILQHNDTTCKNKSKGARWPANLILSYPEEEYILKNDITEDEKKIALKWIYENA